MLHLEEGRGKRREGRGRGGVREGGGAGAKEGGEGVGVTLGIYIRCGQTMARGPQVGCKAFQFGLKNLKKLY